MNEFFDTPLLLDPDYARHAIAEARRLEENLSTVLFPVATRAPDRDLFAGSVAIIRVMGSLWHRGWRSYEWVAQDFVAAMENPDVKGIVFDIDSPGGVVNGAFDLSDFIFENRSTKPTLAIVNERATSGAFAIASAAERVVVPRTGHVGSVGVVMTHLDMSKWMERVGDNITLIFAGDHKVDGNPYEPLPDSVRNRFQAKVNDTYELFVATIARNRGMKPAAVASTEALVYEGQAGVDVGFADAVMPARDALLAFADQVNERGVNPMKIKVSELKQQLKNGGVDDEQIAKLGLPGDDEEIDIEEDEETRVETPAGDEPEGNGAGDQQLTAEEERERVKGIMGSEHAVGREKLAQHLAFETSMSVEQAEKVLAASEKGKADPLSAAMDGVGSPDVTDDGDDPSGTSVEQSWDTALAKARVPIKKSAA